MRTLTCHQCNFSTNRSCNLAQHQKAVHAKIKDFQCPHCDYASSLKVTLLQHIKAKHHKIKDQCPHCPFSTSFSHALSRHIKAKHKELAMPQKSNHRNDFVLCGEAVFLEQNEGDSGAEIVAQHSKEDDVTESNKCPHCSYSSKWEHDLQAHIKAVHKFIVKSAPIQNSTDSHCKECNMKNSDEEISQHVKIIPDNEKGFGCVHCKVTAFQKSHIVRHVKAVHYRIKNLKCPHCSYLTGWPVCLSKHVKSVHENTSENSVKTSSSSGNKIRIFKLSGQENANDFNEAFTKEELDIVVLTNDEVDDKKVVTLEHNII